MGKHYTLDIEHFAVRCFVDTSFINCCKAIAQKHDIWEYGLHASLYNLFDVICSSVSY